MFRSKKVENRRIGQIGEVIAARFLERKGFTILERNLKYKFGEVDIIARKGNNIHFVEVKSVRMHVSRENYNSDSHETYRPEEQVHPEKLRKIRSVASVYMENKGKGLDCQIDVMAVFIDEARKVGKCRFNKNVT
jgi:putative endonuclease